MNRSASPPFAVWLAKLQCGMENTSCCDQSNVCSPTVERPEPDTTRQIMLQVVRFGRVGCALRQPHRIAIERRHHRAAGRGIGVAQRVRAIRAGRQRGQQPPRRRAGIAIFRRMRRRVLHIGADQAGLGPQLLVALIDLPELVGLGIARLEEIGVELADQRNVGGVEPDDAVVAVVDVAVPAHRRRQDQIAVVHVAAPAVDDGGRAFGARRKPDRREGVAMRPRPVAGIEHGEGRDQVGGRHRLAAERRIDQDQRAALDVVDRAPRTTARSVNGSMSLPAPDAAAGPWPAA